MSKGKKFIKKIKALKDIHGVVVKGNVYETDDLMKLFPYIDFKNKDYFEEIFDNKFKIGDEVYVSDDFSLRGISPKTTFVINKVYNQVRGELLYTQYDVYNKEDSKRRLYTIDEHYLTSDKVKYLVSLTSPTFGDRPAVHEIKERVSKNRFDNTWKKYMVFDTREEATEFAYKLKDFLLTNGNR